MFLFKSLTKITFHSPLKAFIPSIFSAPFSYYYKTEALLKDLTPKELSNHRNIKKLLKTHIPGKMKRSQRGLFNRKNIRTGNQTCFSEKKSRIRWHPNIQKYTFTSQILKKTLRIEVTTKALRCIRKFGGFDNYVLLSKPKNLDSIFGEYLRKLMLTKLNDSKFKTPYLMKSNKYHFKHRQKHFMVK